MHVSLLSRRCSSGDLEGPGVVVVLLTALYTPSCRSAVAVINLKVEPGVYAP